MHGVKDKIPGGFEKVERRSMEMREEEKDS